MLNDLEKEFYLDALRWWNKLTPLERQKCESVWYDVDNNRKPTWSNENLKIIELYTEYLLNNYRY